MKKLSFKVFFDEFIEGKTIYNVKQSVNQIFYGSVTLEKISQSSASKMRDENYIFSSRSKIFQDYIISNHLSVDDKIKFIKKLNLRNLPESPSALCKRLSEYELTPDISFELYNETDTYSALVKLLEHIMHIKGSPTEELKKTVVNKENSMNNSWNTELIKSMNNKDIDIPLDSFKTPIGWFIQLISNYTKFNTEEFARRTNLAHVTFTQKTNPNIKRKKHLYLVDIQKICKALGISLGTILYCYEHKEIFEKNPELIDSTCFYEIKDNEIAIAPKPTKKEGLLTDSNENAFEKWFNQYFCYFSSTNSKETYSGLKIHAGSHCNNDDYQELAELFTDDHIYCGFLTIAPSENQSETKCIATLRFMVNPKIPIIKEYEGSVTISRDKHSIFIELFSEVETEKTYLIIEDTNGNNKVRCAMASFLTVSSLENHRKPCVGRMIISEQRIYPNTRSYQFMKSNLKMHDKYIRIDTYGFNEVIKELKASGRQECLDIAEKYNELGKLDTGNTVTCNELAYIKDTLISNLTNLTREQQEIFETSLRLHSIAPWYSKANSKKARDLIELLQEEENNKTY